MYALCTIEQHEKVAFPQRQCNQVCWMRRSGHNLSIPLQSCSFLCLFCFLLVKRLVCATYSLDSRTFAEKGRRTKVVKRKWKIEKNNKEQVQFTTLRHYRRPPGGWWYKEKLNQGGIFHKEWKKTLTRLQFN